MSSNLTYILQFVCLDVPIQIGLQSQLEADCTYLCERTKYHSRSSDLLYRRCLLYHSPFWDTRTVSKVQSAVQRLDACLNKCAFIYFRFCVCKRPFFPHLNFLSVFPREKRTDLVQIAITACSDVWPLRGLIVLLTALMHRQNLRPNDSRGIYLDMIFREAPADCVHVVLQIAH